MTQIYTAKLMLVSAINNGFGIFTEMSSDELLLEIKPE
jgi:hypothetical protein